MVQKLLAYSKQNQPTLLTQLSQLILPTRRSQEQQLLLNALTWQAAKWLIQSTTPVLWVPSTKQIPAMPTSHAMLESTDTSKSEPIKTKMVRSTELLQVKSISLSVRMSLAFWYLIISLAWTDLDSQYQEQIWQEIITVYDIPIPQQASSTLVTFTICHLPTIC